ncbi:hypothetical protein NJT12_13670 [Flavobacterium sp. AC]|uniref:Photosystem reaction center subunit H n=1 Tax=Flavobacterium azizsancarii TaxID=2961580 RepID=A0ABT4WDR8_9FLAO|nr:hypothetical protein [Flavobacterium azizsancarii]MDA6070672.1 hypothetical protein [Flavobacterium azizsancarii]
MRDLEFAAKYLPETSGQAGRNLIASGPLFKAMKEKENKLILSFTDTGSGLMAGDNGILKGFVIAGHDRKFVWANAVIQGDKIIVWSDVVISPSKVRYAWADNPVEANICNKEDFADFTFEADSNGRE